MTMDIVKRSVLALAVALATAFLAVATAQSSVAELRAAVQETPEDAEAWTRLGNAAFEAGELEDAKDAYLEAIALDYLLGDAHFGLGLVEFARGDFQGALFAFNEVTRLFPDRFDGHYNRAVTLATLRRPGDAAAAFRAALAAAEPEATRQDRLNAYVGLAGQLVRSEEYRAAAEAFREALVLSPDDTDLAYNRGAALVAAGEGLTALAELTEVESRTGDFRFSVLIAEVYVDQGQVDFALRALERAVRKAVDAGDRQGEASSLVALGELQRGLGRESAAAASFERAVEVDPASWEARYNLGVSLLTSGQTRAALAPLQEAARLQETGIESELALAGAYDQLGMSGEALASARRVLDRASASDADAQAQARFVVGRALYLQGDYAGASDALAMVVQARPGSASAQLWAGLARYMQGDFQGAALFYERAVQLDPNSIEARVNLGAAYLASERYTDAEGVYRLLVQQNAQDAESQYHLGWSLYAQQRDEDARIAWSNACQLGYQAGCTAPRQ
jgi:tetratricopeptide (TPR) repeat protein